MTIQTLRLPLALMLLLAAPAIPSGQVARAGGTRAEALRTLGDRLSQGRTSGLPTKCGLPAVAAAVRAGASLSTQERLALFSVLQRQERQTSLVTVDHLFKFHFDTTGIDAPAILDSAGRRIPGTARAFVDSAASIAGNVYRYETGTLGFLPPPADGTLGGGPEYDIYIYNLGSDTYGLTTPDNGIADGGTSSTFIEIHNDFSFVSPAANRGIPSLRVTLAHEFHHAIQIGAYGYWPADVWFHEITSVWMEDMAYHGENDYINYLFSTESQFRTPDVPLTYTFSSIMYSRGILGKYFTKKFGAPTMLHIWQHIRSADPLTAIDATLRALPTPTTLGVAFADWALWNYYTGPRADTVNYYDEAAIFPVINETYYDLISPSQTTTGSLSCLATDYRGYSTGSDTVTVALVNMNTTCPAGAQTSSPYTLTVSRNRPDDSYRSIAGNLFLRLDVSNSSQWVTWAIDRHGLSASAAGEGSAFPNPFYPGNGGMLYMPAEADGGTLSVYSSGMELVYSGPLQTQQRLGQRVFAWNGLTKGNSPAPTGVYLFVLSLQGRTVTGKFALVRR
ncbi:MAG TPA: MXAN_6640 family putative metalloprotease [Bacteroidota bacterium]|nr:MXAN_6640 family putative metalloprotease [Bacteroidota bacterium]